MWSSGVVHAAAALVWVGLVAGPVDVYAANTLELRLVLRQAAPVVVSLAALAVGALVALGALTPRRGRPGVAAVLAGLALVTWAHGSFVGPPPLPLDGASFELPWSVTLGVDLAAWLCVAAAPLALLRAAGPGAVQTLAAGLVALTSIAMVARVATLDEHADLKAYGVGNDTKFAWSRTRNVLVVILDEFQSDLVDGALTLRPELNDELSGFVWYRDALATARQTFPAVPEVLTGQRYVNQAPVADYLRQAWSDGGVVGRFARAGFRAELYPFTLDTIVVQPDYVANAVPARLRLGELLRLWDVALLRTVPRALAPWVYASGTWRLSRLAPLDPAFTSDTSPAVLEFHAGVATATASLDAPTMKVYHLFGMHVPLGLDASLARVSPPYGREAATSQAAGLLRVVAGLAAKIDALGLGASTDVIVLGDHGSGRTPDLWIAPQAPDRAAFNVDKARGASLLLVRRAGASGPLVVSDAPVSNADLPATLLDLAGLSRDGVDGVPVDEVPPGPRARVYDAYDWEGFSPRHLPPIRAYVVDGPVRDDASWRQSAVHVATSE